MDFHMPRQRPVHSGVRPVVSVQRNSGAAIEDDGKAELSSGVGSEKGKKGCQNFARAGMEDRNFIQRGQEFSKSVDSGD